MKKLKFITLLLTAFMINSCSVVNTVKYSQTWNGIIQFSPAKNDVFTSSNLMQFIKTNSQPKIVLRAPDSYSSNSVVRIEDISSQSLYNNIEKELMKAGFIVVDRKLFESEFGQFEVIDGNIKQKKYDADLILELVDLSSVEFATNTFKTKNKEVVLSEGQIKMTGLRAEFRVVLLKNNEVAGSYKFNYAPCIDGCNYLVDYYGNLYRSKKNEDNKVLPYEVMFDNINPFIIQCTQDLIKELRQ